MLSPSISPASTAFPQRLQLAGCGSDTERCPASYRSEGQQHEHKQCQRNPRRYFTHAFTFAFLALASLIFA